MAPLFLLITAITLFMFIIVHQVSEYIFEDYHTHSVMGHTQALKEIINRAVTEPITSGLLTEKVAADARKKSVIDDIAAYWGKNNLKGGIVTAGGEVLYSSLDNNLTKELPEISSHEGIVHMRGGGLTHSHGYTIHLPVWNWRIVSISGAAIPWGYSRRIVFLALCIAVSSVAMGWSVFIVLNNNFHRPLKGFLSDLRRSGAIKGTGISELDTIGSAINESFSRLNRKTEQYQTLHQIAISLHEDVSTDEILNSIIDKASRLIQAELAAIALYDETGKFRKLLTKGATIKTSSVLPEGKGILEYTRLSLAPVRIDHVAAHPAFSGSFPEGHPAIDNLLAYPIFSEEGSPRGALYFGNKPGGFTDEDELILKAISADAAIAISKSESIMQLRRFKQVIDSAFDVIMITDADGLVTYANPAFEALTEHRVEEAVGRKTSIVKSGYHGEAFYKRLWATIRAGDVWKGEFINRKKNGELYYASAIIFPIHTGGEINYASIQRDITHEKRLYEQLLRAQKMEAIGTLAGGIAHDFNNLLTAILGYSEIMLSATKADDAFHRPATIIYNAAGKGAELAKKILMVTRKEKMETKPVNINEVIRNSMELLQRSIPKNIEIITNLSESIMPVRADAAQIQQVIMNLAVNARDAMPDGGVLNVETSVVGSEHGAADDVPDGKNGFIKISISDTGTGMDLETQRKIFDPFFTTKDTGKGTGLGLYIVHSVVNDHGGYINLYSEQNKGTRFNIYLPTAKEEDTGDAGQAEDDITGSETILVIDDDSDVRELCKDMLEPLGYTVISSGNGNDGINIFRQMKDKITLVVLDMIMPKMGGNEVFQALKTIKPDVKVLLCSGYSYNGFAGIDKLLKSGVKLFIQKPFTRHAMARAIKKALTE